MPAVRRILYQSAFDHFGESYGDIGHATAKRDYLSFKNRAHSSGNIAARAQIECDIAGSMEEVMGALVKVGIHHMTTREPSLEELFLSHYGTTG